MTHKDKRPDPSTRPSNGADTPQAGSFLSSEQAKQTLRWLAEDIIKRKASLAPENLQTLSSEEMGHLMHELRVHQIELEIQNEELRRTQQDLEASRARFVDLYDFAPVGYMTVSVAGLLLEANLTIATLLGVTRSWLIKKPITSFILEEDQDIYYHHRKLLFETGRPQDCELRLIRSDGPPLWALLKATLASEDADGHPTTCRVAVTDISKRKQAEQKLHIAYKELELRVQERTEQLSEANANLSIEIAERKQAEKDREEALKPFDAPKVAI